MNYYEVIVETVREILREKEEAPPRLAPETKMTETGLDSLDIAGLIARLEDRVGFDPFDRAAMATYPQTLGQLAEWYERFEAREG